MPAFAGQILMKSSYSRALFPCFNAKTSEKIPKFWHYFFGLNVFPFYNLFGIYILFIFADRFKVQLKICPNYG
jgi:hypothetical protein